MPLPALDPEPSVSTNSTTSAMSFLIPIFLSFVKLFLVSHINPLRRHHRRERLNVLQSLRQLCYGCTCAIGQKQGGYGSFVAHDCAAKNFALHFYGFLRSKGFCVACMQSKTFFQKDRKATRISVPARSWRFA